MLITTTKYNRNKLTDHQKEAFKMLVPLSITISDWIESKCRFLSKETSLVPASLILADLIYESAFLIHPLSKPVFMGKYSNNLSLILRDESWQGKINIYEDRKYKSYRDWLHFASDYSDIITFSPKYADVLKSYSISQQIDILSLKKPNSVVYNKEIRILIDHYNLGEFDGREGTRG